MIILPWQTPPVRKNVNKKQVDKTYWAAIQCEPTAHSRCQKHPRLHRVLELAKKSCFPEYHLIDYKVQFFLKSELHSSVAKKSTNSRQYNSIFRPASRQGAISHNTKNYSWIPILTSEDLHKNPCMTVWGNLFKFHRQTNNVKTQSLTSKYKIPFNWKFLDPTIYPDPHQHLMGSSMAHCT